MKNDIKIYVIVVTYKGGRWYDECFGSLRKSTLPVTTIAVDNASGDGSVDYIRKHFPEVIIMENNENLGFGRANNIGLKYALEHDCDYVFLLNQDAWLDVDALEHLIEVAENNLKYGVLSPVHLDKSRKHINMMVDYHHNQCSKAMLSDLYCCGSMAEVYTTDYINAAGWLLPRKTLTIIGGFTPLIYHYGEDDDYMARIRYHQLLLGIVPAARMVHDHQEQFDKSKDLYIQSNIDVPEDYVNINDKRDANGFCRYYFWSAIGQMIRGNKNNAKLFWHRYKFIFEHKEQIDFCREQNKKKQPNWIS